jgi:hypothetical protein
LLFSSRCNAACARAARVGEQGVVRTAALPIKP